MSIKVMSRVWDQSKQSGSDLLTLLALADHADDDGICWPGLARIAYRARIGVRQTKRVVKTLAEGGEIFIDQQHGQHGGRGYTNRYLITVGLTAPEIEAVLCRRFEKTPIEAHAESKALAEAYRKNRRKGDTSDIHKKGDIQGQKGDIQGQKGDIQGQKGDIAMSPESSKNHHEPLVESSGGEQKNNPAPISENQKVNNNQNAGSIPVVIKIYQEATGLFPAKSLWPQLVEKITEPDRWRTVILAWLACGWSPRNVAGMLEHYEQNRIPSTRKDSSNGPKQNANHRPAGNTGADIKTLTPEERAAWWEAQRNA